MEAPLAPLRRGFFKVAAQRTPVHKLQSLPHGSTFPLRKGHLVSRSLSRRRAVISSTLARRSRTRGCAANYRLSMPQEHAETCQRWRTGCPIRTTPQKTIRRLSNRFALVAETHKRFGRGLGKGMCDGTLAAICRVSCVDGPTAGLTGKAAIGSLDADLRTACDL